MKFGTVATAAGAGSVRGRSPSVEKRTRDVVDETVADPTPDLRTIVIGGDALALRVCEELARTAGHDVTVLWDPGDDLQERFERVGARFVSRRGDERDALLRAGVREAAVVMALTDDDHLNLRYVLGARDLCSNVRIVLRQFNRTLGRKIETNLRDCSVRSLSSLSAATYASAAVDPACFAGLLFPDIDGPLYGFSTHRADALGLAERSLEDAERILEGRIVARDGETDVDRATPLRADEELVVFRAVRQHAGARRRARAMAPQAVWAALVRTLRTLDPVVRGTLAVALAIFAIGTTYFGTTLHLDPLRAAYFVLATMTTTGYGDIAPTTRAGELVAMALMLSGIAFSGVFIAVLSTRFTQAQYVSIQGLRRIARRGHVVVCGAGNVGSRVAEYLQRLGATVVVVEVAPTAETVERSRERHFDLLTGDASKDATLDLCNLGEAAAVVALTNSDTMNLEIALGARARNPDLHVVMRVRDDVFEKAVRRHFGFYRTFGTAALAAPVFAGLTRAPGLRGRIAIGDRPYSIVEFDATVEPVVPPDSACVPLGADRAGTFVPLSSFAQARVGERVLMLYPLWRYRRDVVARAEPTASVETEPAFGGAV